MYVYTYIEERIHRSSTRQRVLRRVSTIYRFEKRIGYPVDTDAPLFAHEAFVTRVLAREKGPVER